MKGIEALKRRVGRLEAAIPKSAIEPWPPEEGSFSWCMWMKLEQPVEKMRTMDMYNAVAEIVWSGEDEIYAEDCEVSIC